MKAFNIIWDVDDERDLQFLPILIGTFHVAISLLVHVE